jgi:hypothetical protein
MIAHRIGREGARFVLVLHRHVVQATQHDARAGRQVTEIDQHVGALARGEKQVFHRPGVRQQAAIGADQ